MQKPSKRHKLTSDNNIIKFKKPVHDPLKTTCLICGWFTVCYQNSANPPRHSFYKTIEGVLWYLELAEDSTSPVGCKVERHELNFLFLPIPRMHNWIEIWGI